MADSRKRGVYPGPSVESLPTRALVNEDEERQHFVKAFLLVSAVVGMISGSLSNVDHVYSMTNIHFWTSQVYPFGLWHRDLCVVVVVDDEEISQ